MELYAHNVKRDYEAIIVKSLLSKRRLSLYNPAQFHVADATSSSRTVSVKR